MYRNNEESRSRSDEKIDRLKGIGDFIREYWKALTLVAIVAVIVVFLVNLFWAGWLFDMRVNGWWMQNKAGVNIWDISFEKGYYWSALWIIPLSFFLADPFFWRKRGTMRVVYKSFERDLEKTGLLERSFVGLMMAGARTLVGFLVGLATAHGFATQWLLVDTYLKSHGMNWIQFIQGVYLQSVNHYLFGGLPSVNYLIENTVVFDFLGMLGYLLIPILIYYTAKLVVSAYASFERYEFNWVRVLRAILSIIFVWFVYFGIIRAPATSGDISVPIFMWWRLAALVVMASILVFLRVGEKKILPWIDEASWKASSTYLITIAMLLVVFLAPYAVAWYSYSVNQSYSASKSTLEFPYKISPHISYMKWTNDLDSIEAVPLESIQTTADLEETILRDIRSISYTAAIKRMIDSYSSIGQPWMKLALEEEEGKYFYGPMIIWSNEHQHEYWVCPTSPVLPEQSDTDVNKKFVYTHSEVVMAVDASTGRSMDFSEIFPQVDTSKLSMYYGIGGLFKDQDIAYLKIGNWTEAHLSTYKGPKAYDATPDYVFKTNTNVFLGANELWSYFFWRDMSIAGGKYGDEISILFKRDANERVKSLLIGGLEVETEPTTGKQIPYIVVDPEGNVYLAYSVNIDRSIDNDYIGTQGYLVKTSGDFRRRFAVVLVNLHDGFVKGYRCGDWDENYITQYFASFYGAWDNDMPDWLVEQMRYSKSLMHDTVDLYNTYHIGSTDWESWYKTLNMYDFPVDGNWNYFDIKFDDIKYIPMCYQGTLQYAGTRIVEMYKEKAEGGQWIARPVIGMYIFLGNGKKLFAPLQSVLSIQQVLDKVHTNPEIQNILTTTKNQGQEWQEGNLLIYVVGGTEPIFFIPYYTMTERVMQVTMMVAINGTSGEIGYDRIGANPTPETISSSASKAFAAMSKGILKGTQERIDAVKNELINAGVSVETPAIVNPMIAYSYSTIDFKITQDRENAFAVIHSFVDEVCKPSNITKVYLWVGTKDNTKILSIGALKPDFEMSILTIKIE